MDLSFVRVSTAIISLNIQLPEIHPPMMRADTAWNTSVDSLML
jgi:hypothetical protein